MATLAHLSTNRFIISRLVTVSGYKQDYTTTTGIKGTLQPLSPEKTQLYAGIVGKTYVIYVDSYIDLNEGDKLRDVDTGAIYKVVNGGQSQRAFGIIDYKKVIIQLVS